MIASRSCRSLKTSSLGSAYKTSSRSSIATWFSGPTISWALKITQFTSHLEQRQVFQSKEIRCACRATFSSDADESRW